MVTIEHQSTAPDTDEAVGPLISLVICSRNDDHGGNATWRLEIALNYLGKQAAESIGIEAVEVIVSDWGSDEPLRKVLNLTVDAARVTRFLEISTDLAKERQQDSPFAEVIANNAAIRRARGQFIGRIDQDTLVGAEFLRGFQGLIQAGTNAPPYASSFMFVGRRSIPFAFSRRSFSLQKVSQFVEAFGSSLPTEGQHQRPWFDAPVGVAIMHRKLWHECRAYDERLLYWGFMETDLALRISERYTIPPLNLQPRIGCYLYHLAHARHRLGSTNRRKNARVHPQQFAPNPPDWGLQGCALELTPAVARQQEPVHRSWTPTSIQLRFGALVAHEWIWQQTLAWCRTFRNIFLGDRISPSGVETNPDGRKGVRTTGSA